MAWSKAFVLVAAVGLAAGVLFAGGTGRSIRAAFDHDEPAWPFATSNRAATTPAQEDSWLDQGLAIVGPAWPFGRHIWERDPDPGYWQEPPLPDYAPYPPDLAQDEGYYPRAVDDQPETAAHAPNPSAPHQSAEVAPLRGDAAAQAAERARVTAQEVAAAEAAH